MPAPHRATTRHLQAAYLFQSEGGLGPRGVYIGRDVFGGSFVYDAWELYERRILRNPNMAIAGQLGYGKSALVKTLIHRQLPFGRRAVVLSPKPGEYDALAEAWGTTPVRVAPGGAVRLNPLDAGLFTAVGRAEAVQLRESLLIALSAGALNRALEPEEQAAAALALRYAAEPEHVTIPDVVAALQFPQKAAAQELNVDVDSLAHWGRKAGLALDRLVRGDLRGMFDGPTTDGVRMDERLTVLDLSALYQSDALGIFMLCASAWLQAARATIGRAKRIEVTEEAWAVLSQPAVADGLRQQWKLARTYGAQNVIVMHGVTDLDAAGDQALIARGLLRDTETRVFYNTPADEVPSTARALGLTETEAAELPRLTEGRALWKIGSRTFLVDHVVGAHEQPLIDTNAGMDTSLR